MHWGLSIYTSFVFGINDGNTTDCRLLAYGSMSEARLVEDVLRYRMSENTKAR